MYSCVQRRAGWDWTLGTQLPLTVAVSPSPTATTLPIEAAGIAAPGASLRGGGCGGSEAVGRLWGGRGSPCRRRAVRGHGGRRRLRDGCRRCFELPTELAHLRATPHPGRRERLQRRRLRHHPRRRLCRRRVPLPVDTPVDAEPFRRSAPEGPVRGRGAAAVAARRSPVHGRLCRSMGSCRSCCSCRSCAGRPVALVEGRTGGRLLGHGPLAASATPAVHHGVREGWDGSLEEGQCWWCRRSRRGR